MDLVRPLPKTASSDVNMLVIIDYYARMSKA